MYLIRGKHNLDFFKAQDFTKEPLHGTIGNFDGMHLGHQAILSNIKNSAIKTNGKTVVFFTEPHASEFFASMKSNNEVPPRLCPWREKFKLLDNFGIDFGFFLKFNNSLRQMTPDEFIQNILAPMKLSSLTIGDDFRFGVNRQGDFNLLHRWGINNNIEVSNTETFKYLDERVSSTRIRKAVSDNNFDLANDLLGRRYTFSGKIVHGQHLGRTIDVPTANLWLPKQKLPISGVYAVQCMLNGSLIDGIANMGIRPTVGGTMPVLEVHLFNFSQDIYAQRLEVDFRHKIREEKKFKNLDMLKSQIKKDIALAKTLLQK